MKLNVNVLALFQGAVLQLMWRLWLPVAEWGGIF